MELSNGIYHLLGRLLIERPARGESVAQLIAQLEENGEAAERRLQTAADSPNNREILRHVIGIERWAQRRLQVALGAPYVGDESDDYFPAEGQPWLRLRGAFAATRRRSLSVARQIQEEGVNGSTTIPHNQWGDLSVCGWLYYLNFHAEKDLKGLQS